MLNLSKDVYQSNLNYLNHVMGEDPEYLEIKSGVVSAMDYINCAFPRFESKEKNLSVLMNNCKINSTLSQRSDSLEVILDLIDGFNVLDESESEEFYTLGQVLVDLYKLPNNFIELDYVNTFVNKVLDEMIDYSYLAGEFDSLVYNIDLSVLDSQLDEQRKIIHDCVSVCSVCPKTGLSILDDLINKATIDSEPYYLPVLKEKTRRVGEFIKNYSSI